MAKNNSETAPETAACGEALPVSRLPLPELAKLVDAPEWQRAAAASLHGWREHVHHAGAPIELTQTDYVAALEAAVTGGGDKPHLPALSLYRGKGM